MEDYRLLLSTAEGFLEEEPFYASALSNISALIMEVFPNLNWAGFYLVRDGRLTVGPFQGKPACIHIEFGKGVCGTSWKRPKSVVVPDVELFPGHIACSSLSRSEIVVPLFAGDEVKAVLDIDSKELATFDETDRLWLEKIVSLL